MPQDVTFSIDDQVWTALESILDREEFQESYIDPQNPQRGVQKRRRFADAEAFFAHHLYQGLATVAAFVPAIAALQSQINTTQTEIASILTPAVKRGSKKQP